MSKLSKSTRTVIIAAAVLLVLGVVCLVLLMTEPKEETSSGDRGTSGSDVQSTVSEVLSEDTKPVLTDKEGTDVETLKITNSIGGYTFNRAVRVVSTADENGIVTSTDEVYWTSEDMQGISINETSLKAFMNSVAGLSATELVEEAAEDLSKYGLDEKAAVAEITFTDGTAAKLSFGINNPAATNYVYCRLNDSRDVYMCSYYAIDNVYLAIESYANLILTDSYNANDPKELDYLVIERKDLSEPIEISYMYDIQEEATDINSVITTFNSHRVTKPMVAEIDSTKGQTLCYGLYGLTAASCVSVKADEALLQSTGLSDPFVKVTFKYGGQRRVLLLGDKIITETETDDPETPTLTTVAGYYGMLEGSDAVYSFDVASAPWYTFTLQDVISRRPLSPYIYSVDYVTVKTPEREYVFDITGDAQENKFTCDGQELDGDKFRSFYQHLIAAVGDELYFEEGGYAPYVSIGFKYRSEYYDVYGTEEDVLEFYQSGDRKNIVRVNGKVLFKVRQMYTQRLIENIDALLNGGEIALNW